MDKGTNGNVHSNWKGHWKLLYQFIGHWQIPGLGSPIRCHSSDVSSAQDGMKLFVLAPRFRITFVESGQLRTSATSMHTVVRSIFWALLQLLCFFQSFFDKTLIGRIVFRMKVSMQWIVKQQVLNGEFEFAFPFEIVTDVSIFDDLWDSNA